jgi:hemerythrin
MNNVQWSAEYSVGIAKIDEQHQDLFGMINELQFLLMRDWNRDMVKDSFERFLKKITEHFNDEECYMELFNYPSKTTHQHYHQELLLKANDVLSRLNAQSMSLTADIADYLEIWLTHHVEGPDRAMGLFLIQSGLV